MFGLLLARQHLLVGYHLKSEHDGLQSHAVVLSRSLVLPLGSGRGNRRAAQENGNELVGSTAIG